MVKLFSEILYQITKEVYSDGSIINYGYESNSNLLRYITDSKGTTQINYDQANNKISIVLPNGYYHSYSFDFLGRLQKKTNFKLALSFTR